jgi:hypothetical protein
MLLAKNNKKTNNVKVKPIQIHSHDDKPKEINLISIQNNHLSLDDSHTNGNSNQIYDDSILDKEKEFIKD